MEGELAGAVGQRVTVRKTVSESDIYLFSGITGDFSPSHIDEAFMRGTQYGRRIAHGALLAGYMSRASTMIVETLTGEDASVYPVSLGYDRVRFLKPDKRHDRGREPGGRGRRHHPYHEVAAALASLSFRRSPSPVLEELQEHLALGGDVELFIDTPAVVLDRSDRNGEPRGDGRRGVPAQDELGQLLLA